MSLHKRHAHGHATSHKSNFMQNFTSIKPETKRKPNSHRTFSASLRSRNAHRHVTRAILEPFSMRLYRKGGARNRHFYTRKLLRTDTFTHRRFYKQTPLHTDAFTQTLLHANTFTYRRFYTQTLLHTDTFTHRRAKSVEEHVTLL